MRRPSFQFYPGDWQANSNLRRCTHAEKGAWLDVMCLMHDQPEYGVLRWSLKEIAQAIGAPLATVRGLVTKGVLKGSDLQLDEPSIYVPRSGRKDGEPVTLLSTQAGPIWYSSRMVKDEYLRTIRGGDSRFGEGIDAAPKTTPKQTPKSSSQPSPKGGIGEGQSDGSSSSSSSSSSIHEYQPPLPPGGGGGGGAGFEAFWSAWPRSERKAAKGKCQQAWVKAGAEPMAAVIVAHIERRKGSRDWLKDGGAYIEAPLVYLNQRRWEGAVDGAASTASQPLTTQEQLTREASNPRPAWAVNAGFENVWEANNQRCYEHNAQQFRNGKRLEVAA